MYFSLKNILGFIAELSCPPILTTPVTRHKEDQNKISKKKECMRHYLTVHLDVISTEKEYLE
jgi:hypothetical protein